MGDMLKIWLPGETPWAEVLTINEDGTRTVRLDNKLAGDYTAAEFRAMMASMFGREPDPNDKRDYRKHSYKFGDVITVGQTDPEFPNLWVPVATKVH